MSTFDALFPIPTGQRNADDMGMPPPLAQPAVSEAVTDPLALAILFHHTYERLAPSIGYDTRTETRIFDPESKNGKLMVAVCREILANAHLAQPAVSMTAAEAHAFIDSIVPREPLTDEQIIPHGRRLGLVDADTIALARAVLAAQEQKP